MSWEAGTPLKTVEKPPFTREQLKAYAPASGDFNPIHLDDEFAKQAGFPSVIVHGMLSMACLADLVAANFPPERYRLKKLKTRFRKVTFPGNSLKLEGKIKKIGPSGELIVGLAAKSENGETTADGEATVQPL